jgi:hypothetical protein
VKDSILLITSLTHGDCHFVYITDGNLVEIMYLIWHSAMTITSTFSFHVPNVHCNLLQVMTSDAMLLHHVIWWIVHVWTLHSGLSDLTLPAHIAFKQVKSKKCLSKAQVESQNKMILFTVQTSNNDLRTNRDSITLPHVLLYFCSLFFFFVRCVFS